MVDLLKTAHSHVRDLLVVANEVSPASAQAGRSTEEQQSEVIGQATLALDAIEDAAMRLGKAKHAFLADDSFFAEAPAADAPAATDTVAPAKTPAEEAPAGEDGAPSAPSEETPA